MDCPIAGKYSLGVAGATERRKLESSESLLTLVRDSCVISRASGSGRGEDSRPLPVDREFEIRLSRPRIVFKPFPAFVDGGAPVSGMEDGESRGGLVAIRVAWLSTGRRRILKPLAECSLDTAEEPFTTFSGLL